MISVVKRMRDAPRRRILVAAGFSLLLWAGCFFILHETMSPPPRAMCHVYWSCDYVRFTPDSNTLVIADYSPRGSIPVFQICDVATGRLRSWLIQPTYGLHATHISPDGRLLALRSPRAGLIIFDLQTGSELAHWPSEGDFVNYHACGFPLDGRYLAIWDGFSLLTRLWDPHTQTEAAQIEGIPIGGELPSHGRDLATWTVQSQGMLKILLWRLPDRGPPVLTNQMLVPGMHVAISPDLTTLATTAPWKGVPEITLWETATGRKRCSIPYDDGENPVQDVEFAAGGRFLVAKTPSTASQRSGAGYLTTVWDLATSPTPTMVTSTLEPVHFSADGKWLALPRYHGATLINVDTAEQRELYVKSDEGVIPLFEETHLEFSPDSRLLAVAGVCRQSRDPLPQWLPARLHRLFDYSYVTAIWNTSSGQEHGSILQGYLAYFSPDGQTLVTVDLDQTIRLWPLPLHRPLIRDLGLSAFLWLTLILLAGAGRVVVRMIFRLGR